MKLLYFAWLREKIGQAEENLTPPENAATVHDLIVWLRTRSPGHAAAFADTKLIRCAIDQEFVSLDAPLASAAELAFFPPVTGG
ncbi:molybdopterin synthase sulfur carrier subunit [Acidocella aquatica]|uniref:Molybdopterin synthase sulfur carrier subunit n=1 Tax=Acidocella aquatica TaxID=1922313 RepID=A0ABQ6AER7_9PROT|nr:molybdopterin converting factor subunit 1 [Acidocella aquatica]GLR68718.1 molybdopterin synthase sulfur carrier subunit [Acidocella aquatica]